MTDDERERLVGLVLRGVDIGTAVQMASHRGESHRAKMTVPSGGASGTPDPACMASYLKDIKPLRREDVLRAIAACAR